MLFSKKTDTNPSPDDTPEQSGFLQKIARMPGGRFITPLVLAATIGGNVQSALADTRHVVALNTASAKTNRVQSYDTIGDLETSVPTEKEVADYFATHLTTIKRSLKKHVTDEKILNSLLKTVEMISKNQDGHSFNIAHNGALSPQVMAQFIGANNQDTIEVKPGFDVGNLADRVHITHEATHAAQKETQEKIVRKGAISESNFNNFWSFAQREKRGMVVNSLESESMAAQVEFLNASLDGRIQKIIDDAPNFPTARAGLQRDKVVAKALADRAERDNLIELSLAYYGKSPKDWESYVQYLYECKLRYQPFTEKLSLAHTITDERCDDLGPQSPRSSTATSRSLAK